MKTPLLLCALLACAAPLHAQPTDDTAPKLTNDLPFPLVAPARAEQLAMPRPIVINLKDATLGEALDQLKTQSGIDFGTLQGNYGDQLDTKLSVQINTLSFNEAFRQITDAAGLKASLQNWGNNQNPQLFFGGEDASPNPIPRKSGAGLFEIDLASVDASNNKSVDLSNFETPQRTDSNTLGVTLTLQSDRRLAIVGSPQTRVTRAEDEQGRSLVPKPKDDQDGGNSVNRYNFYSNSVLDQPNVTLDLTPAPKAKTLAHLEGVVVYAVVTKTDAWAVPDLLAAPEWTRTFTGPEGTVAVKVAATPNTDDENGGLKVKIEATSSNYDEASETIGYPLSQAEPLMAAIRIVDGNGQVYRNNGFNASGGQTTRINAIFLPENDPQNQTEEDKASVKGPFKFVMNAPIEVVQTEVPFDFENVPLP